MRRVGRYILSAAVVSCLCVGANADVAALRQGLNGYTGTQDTSIFDSDTANSGGGFPYLYIGETKSRGARRGLIKFDLTMLPVGALVSSATLQFYTEPLQSRPAPVQGAVHRLTRAWTEGNNPLPGDESGGTGRPAQPGDTTWDHVSFDTVLWATAGGEFVSTPSGTGTMGGPGTYIFLSGAGLALDVQSWFTAPSTNFGWIVLGDETQPETAKRIYSSESPEPQKPTLFIEYTISSAVDDWALY